MSSAMRAWISSGRAASTRGHVEIAFVKAAR
jgi:hypothetical protein